MRKGSMMIMMIDDVGWMMVAVMIFGHELRLID